MSQMNPKEAFHNTAYTQFNYLTQPVTPFKEFVLFLETKCCTEISDDPKTALHRSVF